MLERGMLPDFSAGALEELARITDPPPPYGREELSELARHCTEKETDAGKVERQVGKSAAAMLLESRIEERFDAIVTGASQKRSSKR
ncbi:MAG: hypothetical protein IH577_03830 [Deltaproteobacteria bacterium]|nr:hypothetical protein [Deltaproteobacteria bacterium]